ncbi:MAG: hypothetical protein ABI241_10755 [Bacteroidia bacterium]
MKNFLLFVFLSLMIALISCNNNVLNVDVSSINIPKVIIKRLDKDIFNMDTTAIPIETKRLQAKYGSFYSTFITGIINNGDVRDSSYAVRIKQFINNRDMKEVYTDCNKKYADVSDLETQFTDAFKHFIYYFPEKKLPQVISMISGFNYSIFPIDTTLAIGLDMYLGSRHDFYKMLGYPRYKSEFMNRENILPDAISGWLINEFPYHTTKNDFLSELIYMGKILYLTDAVLPTVADTLKIRYTQQQIDYCTENEFNLWSYFTAQQLLYTTNQTEIMKFTSEGPFTSSLSKEAPPRIGYWVGWQIVKQYMKNNDKTTLIELMNENDAQAFLKKSRYKPKKS